MDGSNSLSRTEYTTALRFIQSIVRSLPISGNEIQAGMIEYSDKPSLQIPLNQKGGKLGLTYGVLYVRNSGGTKASTPEMIELATKEGFSKKKGARPGVPKYLLIVTDDEVTPSDELRDAVDKAKEAGVNVYVVNIGDKMNTEGLKILAPVAKNRYTVDDVSSLDGIIDGLLKNIFKDVADREYQDIVSCQNILFIFSFFVIHSLSLIFTSLPTFTIFIILLYCHFVCSLMLVHVSSMLHTTFCNLYYRSFLIPDQ